MTTTSNRDLRATEALIVSLDEYIRAMCGLLAVQTFEQERFMRGVADHERHGPHDANSRAVLAGSPAPVR